jgi:hypothetical protein
MTKQKRKERLHDKGHDLGVACGIVERLLS